ncbi:MAG: hypothetical protein H7061_02995 [Bdellovibrionaceae bacterium]|nr:hypothetical protein [Bdellovibrio sp.]
MKINKKTAQLTMEKLKELKTWAQVKSPRRLQPALSYALDWLSPELLGTGFRLYEAAEFELKATIPANKSNLDFQNEIHQGLVANASVEMTRCFLQKQMPESFFQIIASHLQIDKKQKWSEEIHLQLKTDAATMDDFFIDLQKQKKATLEFKIAVATSRSKKHDQVGLKLTIESTPLLA